ncbi:hypothetical protein AKJ44_02590 [candidate division MSBL1 archaeon SCGC-AAA261F17]|uniref:Polymerase beta nucleotidyltransferase domain-containing protein n=1 Tax=candidate division MSBL1 archaeon SCGC-AAA261F17 TaxID=1698274 RepID=A0A133V4N7_9EURY|nr:hypothetical protein AKJ44_02590 [candidate division MSBL1 archaeon SCGC-AAA261F17]
MDRQTIEKDFSFLKERKGVLAVLLFGSRVTKREHERSDVDICIVAPEEDPWSLWLDVDRRVRSKGRYDFHIFEDFGLKMKHQVLENHEIIWCRDEPKLHEYFYTYRKLWDDQAKARGVAARAASA